MAKVKKGTIAMSKQNKKQSLSISDLSNSDLPEGILTLTEPEMSAVVGGETPEDTSWKTIKLLSPPGIDFLKADTEKFPGNLLFGLGALEE